MSTIEELARSVLDGSARGDDVKELAEQALEVDRQLASLTAAVKVSLAHLDEGVMGQADGVLAVVTALLKLKINIEEIDNG